MTDIESLMTQVERWYADAIAAHETGGAARLRNVLLVEYRCRVRGCLLLHVWQSPEGLMYYAPRQKVSAERNADWPQHVAPDWQGRRKPAKGGNLDVFGTSDHVPMGLQCDHLAVTVNPQTVRADAESTTPGKPVRRPLPVE